MIGIMQIEILGKISLDMIITCEYQCFIKCGPPVYNIASSVDFFFGIGNEIFRLFKCI